MKSPASRPAAIALLGAAAFLGTPVAHSCDLQRGNEVYLDARSEVAALPPREKERVAQEWAELEAEQKSLWALAGEIDEECRRGELSAQIAPYNARVYEWQDSLRKFLKRARTPLDSPSGKPEPQPVQATQLSPLSAPQGNGTSEIEFPASPATQPKAKLPPQPPAPPAESITPKTLL